MQWHVIQQESCIIMNAGEDIAQSQQQIQEALEKLNTSARW